MVNNSPPPTSLLSVRGIGIYEVKADEEWLEGTKPTRPYIHLLPPMLPFFVSLFFSCYVLPGGAAPNRPPPRTACAVKGAGSRMMNDPPPQKPSTPRF